MKLSFKKTAQGVDVMIPSQLANLQDTRQVGLLKQITSLCFLLRQGLAIRGHSEDEGNLSQLLKLRTEDSDTVQTWLNEEKYMSHDIVNELIYIMGQEVLRCILHSVKSANPSWYAIIPDEATDVSNNEQFNISIRWVDNQYTILEEPIGLVQLSDTFANTLVTAIKDMLRRCNLPLGMCCGQAYDGAANMQGLRNGVATQIQAEVPLAIPVHCLAHCLQLVSQEAGRKCRSLREVLELVKEIVKLVKLSPKRSTLFVQNLENYEGGVP